jgi:hypothetical protein
MNVEIAVSAEWKVCQKISFGAASVVEVEVRE